jgi:hypothetical protein
MIQLILVFFVAAILCHVIHPVEVIFVALASGIGIV